MLALLLAVAAVAPQGPGPVEFGREAVDRAFKRAELNTDLGELEVKIDGQGAPESFTLNIDGPNVKIVASDAVGAMYGELEFAERVESLRERAFEKLELRCEPYLSVRAINPFLTLPWNSEKNEPIYDRTALVDPARWWFHDEDYWTTLFDLMAEARLNQLDLHGAYDIHTTRFPNLYAYFVDSKTFPEVGVPSDIKRKNLAQLAHVIELAHARGVKVSLMSYEARFDTPHVPNTPYSTIEENLYTYTREVVEAMIRALPKLDAIGFRIGESGHGAEFFQCYLDAVKASGRDIPLYTRSWVTRKRVVVPLAVASSDFTVEIKFNGEQWGPPYPIAGGRVPGWHSYSFEDYLSDSNVKSAAKMWEGDLADNGERWPSQPYKIVWQVRANGTHRIFPFYQPDWVRRTVQSMPLGTARGFSVEMLNSYFPATPRYYLANPKDQWCKWIHQRDAVWLIQWGRLGYDPKTPEDVFERAIEKHLGKDARERAGAWKSASTIVPSIFTAYSFGPDHRDQAPELEWGGNTEDFIQSEPFDSHVFMSIKERLALLATGGVDGRINSINAPVDRAVETLALPPAGEISGARREIDSAIAMTTALGTYYKWRWTMADVLASAAGVAPGTGPAPAEPVSAADGYAIAIRAWEDLATSTEAGFYRPFTDRLRMGTNDFHWRDQSKRVQEEAARYAAPISAEVIPRLAQPIARPRSSHVARPQLRWRLESEGRIRCSLSAAAKGEDEVLQAWLLEKPLPSSTFFHKREMSRAGDEFVSSLSRRTCGSLICAEVRLARGVIRIPWSVVDRGDASSHSFLVSSEWSGERPYLVIPAQSGSTPSYYSSQEALKFLKPTSLDPAKHGLLFLATRASDFHRSFDTAQQRKLLDAVKRGMKLLVLQQDYVTGRYSLDWLPQPPAIESAPVNVFDPAGVLGLERVETEGVLFQPIRPSEGWEVFGNGGIARCKLGKGEMWMCQARLMQRMHIPGCARNLKKLIELGGREKPTVVVDAGSEGNRYATSVFCDFMNAHDVPFLTLGEVIVNEQGMDSFDVVPGIVSADRVLEGRGGAMVADWLAKKIRERCNRPVPATVEAFESERARRRSEFLRAIGLEPLPPRNPLNARVTGVLERDGYTLEKLVFESRPGFPVTAHLYVPKGRAGEKLPVIVNATGHWPHKKTEPTEQARLIGQVRAGYLALEVDSPGHSYEGDAKIERRGAGSHHQPRLIAGSTTADTVYVWDLMRAVDYLATRPEADMARVGITGVSGGGHATMFAFAADERFRCAVPVCYATSFLDGWNNGCNCNHVPGYMQVGDRADVIAIRAPAPVFVFGAKDDPEFPPLGTQHTGEKLAATWKLFGAERDARWKVFDGGHDYSKVMRETAIGFFDLHLRGKGDGSPVPETAIATEPPESAELVCLPDPPKEQLTMRDIALANVQRAGRASWDEVVALNGGLPERVPLDVHELPQLSDEPGRPLTFHSERGLTIPGLLFQASPAKAGVVLVHEGGKLAARDAFPIEALTAAGFTCLAIDARGTGELPGLDLGLMSYLGTAPSFAMGWDSARAAELLLETVPRVAVVGAGPCGSLAALYAGLMENRVSLVVGQGALESWSELFDDGVPTNALQPRVMYGATIERLKGLLGRPVEWSGRSARAPELGELLREKLAQ